MQRRLLVVWMMMLAGCGASREAGDASSLKGALNEYERTFRPSDHDQPLKEFFPEMGTSGRKDSVNTSPATVPQAEEFTQGYRVQVFATTSFDDATTMKATVEGQFADEWFYVVYDAPTYKLRGGNFLERYEADRFAKLLSEKGYRDAWVVPERVIKNPPPHIPQPQNLQK